MPCPAGFTFGSGPARTPTAVQTETAKPGDKYESVGYNITWTQNHFPASKLEPLRQIGDDIADQTLEALQVKPGKDIYSAFIAYTARPVDEQVSAAPRTLLQQLNFVPEWLDMDQVRRGQAVYRKYCLFIILVLLHSSLIGGYAIPEISKILNSTGYLAGKKTRQRLFETFQFFVDTIHSVESLQPMSGAAWESIVRIRLLHSGVRTRLTKMSKSHSKVYSVEKYGVPINQEDLLGTLFAFTTAIWRGMESRLGLVMEKQERDDYMHLWRYVGYLMGIDDVLGATVSSTMADAAIDSIVLHLASPDEKSGRMLTSTLFNLSAFPESRWGFLLQFGLPDLHTLHMALAEVLLGAKFWKESHLPVSRFPYTFLRRLIIALLFMDLWFVRRSSWWLRNRYIAVDAAQRWLINIILDKRTVFELRELPKEDSDEHSQVHSLIQNKASWSKLVLVATVSVGAALVFNHRAFSLVW
ncbi:hypothetical protein BGW38_003582 [Lunasporangiospora selenospora]|uniref:ER-bound oxygenase mpaB/mpaB'/Rubber oxygenase catalytic domain-containing protein n=1 Tax=Lunasporangiospora selenospora TaxID=979761 RepID=A0A9P6FQU2_9FUNG|nr:hypothetical protein BGW38_003582 [Lunasporangiospora selenospora]